MVDPERAHASVYSLNGAHAGVYSLREHMLVYIP